MAFKPDGTALYILQATGTDSMKEYAVGTPWDLSTATATGIKSFSVETEVPSSKGFVFNSTGTSLFVASASAIFQYNLSTAWDISTAAYASKSLSCAAQETGITGVTMNSLGNYVYINGSVAKTIFQYALSTPSDISTGAYASKSYNHAFAGTTRCLELNSIGTKIHMPVGSAVAQFSIS
jgi:hypothetical protein